MKLTVLTGPFGRSPSKAVSRGPAGQAHEIGREVGLQFGLVGEGEGIGVGLDEEVEGIDHRQFGDEIDLDLELGRLLRKDEAGQPVALRVLLPVHEVLLRQHLQRIALDFGARRLAATGGIKPAVQA